MTINEQLDKLLLSFFRKYEVYKLEPKRFEKEGKMEIIENELGKFYIATKDTKDMTLEFAEDWEGFALTREIAVGVMPHMEIDAYSSLPHYSIEDIVKIRDIINKYSKVKIPSQFKCEICEKKITIDNYVNNFSMKDYDVLLFPKRIYCGKCVIYRECSFCLKALKKIYVTNFLKELKKDRYKEEVLRLINEKLEVVGIPCESCYEKARKELAQELQRFMKEEIQ